MNEIEVYCADHCPDSPNAMNFLRDKGLPFEEINISEDPQKAQEMVARSGRKTTPQIFIDKQAIGGFLELSEMYLRGDLEHPLTLAGLAFDQTPTIEHAANRQLTNN